jgi:hypothetical protein
LRTPRGRGRYVSIAFDAAARKAGMAKLRLRHFGDVYAIGDGDIFPVFTPQYIGHHGGTSILGSIWLYIKKFELWWADIVDKFPKKQGCDGYVMGIYISNFLSMGVEIFLANEQDRIDEWAEKIVSLSRQIFDPGRELLDIINSENLAGISIDSYFGHSVKTYAFNIWLRLQWPEAKTILGKRLVNPINIYLYQQEYEFLKAEYRDLGL